MPYRWHDIDTAPDHSGAVLHRLELWPHQALTAEGFVWFIGITAGLIGLPLIAVLGSPVLWGLLPFAAIPVAGMWIALRRSWRDGARGEVLELSQDQLALTRRDPGRADRHWQANPYWLRVALRQDGPVEDYLTLAAGGREVELGAFLSPDERRALAADLQGRIAGLRTARR